MAKIVVIDRGHGLPDPGACGNGLQEYERVFVLGTLIGNVLSRHGVQVFFTRTGEKSLSGTTDLKRNKNEDLAARQQISNSKATDFFLSLHMNSSDDPAANGYETLCYSQSAQIEALHAAVKAFLQQNGLRDRGIKVRTDLAVLKVKAKAALLECFFISNPKEAELMKGSVFLSGLAEAISCGVLTAIGVSYVPMKQQEPMTKQEGPKMKQADAEKVITYLQAAWRTAKSADEQKEIGRLADEVRAAAGMAKVNEIMT